MFLWNPTAWPGETTPPLGTTYLDTNAEDAGEKWCPYNSKLNSYVVGPPAGWYIGGRRYEFIADETGDWVFMFWDGTGAGP